MFDLLKDKRKSDDDNKDGKPLQIRDNRITDLSQPKQRVQQERDRGRKNEGDDTGANTAKKRLHTGIFKQIANQG